MLGQMPRHDGKRRSMGPCAAAIAAALLLALPGAVPQAGAETATPSVSLQLVSQRPWLNPDSRLGITLRLTNLGNADLHGFLLRVGVYDRITSRSDLHVSFGGTPDVPASAFTKYFTSEQLQTGESTDIRLRQSVDALPTLGFGPDGGVYPLTIYLYDASGAQLLDSLTTSLIYYPQPPGVPLNLVMVVPLNALPAKGPDGVFHPDASGRYPLADALVPSGWLQGLLDALERWTHRPAPQRHRPKRHRHEQDRRQQAPPRLLRFALAPSPRLLAEVADLADGYQQESNGRVEAVEAQSPTARAAASFMRRATALAASAGVQTMLTPYSFPDLPSLDQNFDLEHLARQVKVGQDVIQSRIGVSRGVAVPSCGAPGCSHSGRPEAGRRRRTCDRFAARLAAARRPRLWKGARRRSRHSPVRCASAAPTAPASEWYPMQDCSSDSRPSRGRATIASTCSASWPRRR